VLYPPHQDTERVLTKKGIRKNALFSYIRLREFILSQISEL
jgi:hypothetical protein